MHIFITGIGTDVGKTIVSSVFVKALNADYFKPIQAGDLHYSDTDKVKALVNADSSHFYSNAYALNSPMSPHASAEIDQVKINKDHINRPGSDKDLIIEGAGGLLVPINQQHCIADLIKPNDKVILVSRHYLGSINHTLLSHHYLTSKRIDYELLFVGEENKSTESIITKMTGKHPIGRLPMLDKVDAVSIAELADNLKNQIKEKLT